MTNSGFLTRPAKWSGGSICSVLLHGLLFIVFFWRFSDEQPTTTPAPAIMVQWADNIEATFSPLPLPVGVAQQESAAAEEKQQIEDRQQRFVPVDREATIEITRKKKSSDGEKKKPRPPRKVKDHTSDSSHASVSSHAAPQAPVE
nr:hypothetical protein [Rosenbergiella nectarea]